MDDADAQAMITRSGTTTPINDADRDSPFREISSPLSPETTTTTTTKKTALKGVKVGTGRDSPSLGKGSTSRMQRAETYHAGSKGDTGSDSPAPSKGGRSASAMGTMTFEGRKAITDRSIPSLHKGSRSTAEVKKSPRTSVMGPPPTPLKSSSSKPSPVTRAASGHKQIQPASGRVKTIQNQSVRSKPTKEPLAISQEDTSQNLVAKSVASSPPLYDNDSSDGNKSEQDPEHEPSTEPGWAPQDTLTTFDWQDLQQRYEKEMQQCAQRENEVCTQLNALNLLFEAWAKAGQLKEGERSRKRLRTRITYVQNEELVLAKQQQHYLHVRDQHKSALDELDNEDQDLR